MSQNQTIGRTATQVTFNGGTLALAVKYHQTEVVKVDRQGVITLDSGGWMTATTKLRMNQAANQYGLGFGVFQKAGKWYVQVTGWPVMDFYDGMMFKRGGGHV